MSRENAKLIDYGGWRQLAARTYHTHACWRIRQGITRAIASQNRSIRLAVPNPVTLNRRKSAQRRGSPPGRGAARAAPQPRSMRR